MLVAAHDAGRLQFFGEHARLADKAAFKAYLAPLREIDWVVYAKEPFAGPRQVLRYLSRYTHRIAISNRRLVAADHKGVTFKYKDYRIEGPARYKTMTLATDEFIRRFLIHVLPKGFHRIRHYGLLATGARAANIAHARELLAVPSRPKEPETPEGQEPTHARSKCSVSAWRNVLKLTEPFRLFVTKARLVNFNKGNKNERDHAAVWPAVGLPEERTRPGSVEVPTRTE